MYTRQDYMNKTCTHTEFYGQFVTPAVVNAVKQVIGISRIMASSDEHFNDIRLDRWEALSCKHIANIAAIRQAHNCKPGIGFWSKNLNVCILKEAARQIKEFSKTKSTSE